jgi:hypothetical protein
MGLTAELELKMTDAGMVKFFDQHRSAFEEMAQESFEYAWGYVHPTGLPVRPDDVAVALELALRTNDTMRKFLAAKRLGQQYWYRYFADLILDRVFAQLSPPNS